ncbi:MAG TPA: ribbon-helix-helix protein, CopG family [candidate division Zixibacteria bacterium]|nr:ribbon-helix-helix protein, CopG family [candidate division Zixibacteria bacterium]
MRKRSRGPVAEQLSVGFEGLEVVEPDEREPAPDTMRQIVSLRMPDALLERVEQAARARGVSPSSLMRALIAAGLDRSYAAVRDESVSDLSAEVAELRRLVAAIAARLGVEAAADEAVEAGVEGVGARDAGR